MNNSLWITPSFEDIPGATVTKGISGRNASSQKQNPLLKSFPNVHSTVKSEPTSNVESWDNQPVTTSGELWVAKHAAQNVEDLAVHKAKVAELRHWFLTAISSCHQASKMAPILLIVGDTGTGKTAALTLLAQELHVEIKEWVNMDTIAYEVGTENKFDYGANTLVESQGSKFSSFLYRASRYSSLGLTAAHTPNVPKQHHIVLVEDFPNVFIYRPTSLHTVLRHYRKHGLCPLVFIVSDYAGRRNEQSLFPKFIKDELKIDTISFNPVAPTMALKVLTKITERESACSGSKINVPDRETLQMLVKSNQGDIRAAINALQFYCEGIGKQGVKRPATQRTVPKNRKASRTRSKIDVAGKVSLDSTTSDLDFAVTGGKDPVLSLFHAVGKILHCKRQVDQDTTGQLPAHLTHLRRKSLLIDNPEDAVEKAHVDPENFISFLHQNYVDFHTNIDDVVISSGYVSDSDCMSDWSSRASLQPYCVSMATRGLLFSYTDAHQSAVGWKPIHKPQLYGVVRQAAENSLKIRDSFPSSNLSLFELQTELVPFASVIGDRHKFDEAKLRMFKSVGRMGGRLTDFQKLCEDDSLPPDEWDNMSEALKVKITEGCELTSGSINCCDQLVVDSTDEEIVIDESD